MNRALLFAAALTTLSACAAHNDQIAHFEASCEQAGMRKDSPEFRGCVDTKWRQSMVYIAPQRAIQCQQIGNFVQCN